MTEMNDDTSPLGDAGEQGTGASAAPSRSAPAQSARGQVGGQAPSRSTRTGDPLGGAGVGGQVAEASTPGYRAAEAATVPDAGLRSADEPITLTRAELEQILAGRDQKILSQAQSLTDKASSRIERQFAELQAAGARALELFKAMPGVTPEQVAQAEQKLHSETLQKALSGPTPNNVAGATPPRAGQVSQEPGANGQPGQGQDADPAQGPQHEARAVQVPALHAAQVTAAGEQIAAQYGGFAEDDPEWALIDVDGSPADYLRSIHYAGRLKQARTQSPLRGTQQGASKPATKAARVPGLGPNGGRATGRDMSKVKAGEAFEDEWKKAGGRD